MDLLCAGALIAIAWRKTPEAIQKCCSLAKFTLFASLAALLALSRFQWFKTSANTIMTNTVIYLLTLLIAVGVVMWALKAHTTFFVA
jgi:hypothetical protein